MNTYNEHKNCKLINIEKLLHGSLTMESQMIKDFITWKAPFSISTLPHLLMLQHRNVSNLAIPAGGIDADIGDTLSVQSWGSKGGRSYTSRKSREGPSHTRQEFGSIMRFSFRCVI